MPQKYSQKKRKQNQEQRENAISLQCKPVRAYGLKQLLTQSIELNQSSNKLQKEESK